MPRSLTSIDDGHLVEQAVGGDTGSFEELYRRHAEAAWRVARSVSNDAHDAADAVSEAFTRVLERVRDGDAGNIENFRSYLLTAVRNAGLDRHRRAAREQPDQSMPTAAGADAPSERVIDLTDAALAASAFDDLPQRWQQVLWLTEVEDLEASEVAVEMGVHRGALAQLTHRARAGLREGYVRAHLSGAPPGCGPTVRDLGAYVLDRLPPGKRARVETHLEGCEACRLRREEVEELGTSLKRAVLPLPAGLAAMATGRFAQRLGGSVLRGGAELATTAPGTAAKLAVGAAAAGIAVAGLLSLGEIESRAGTPDHTGSTPGTGAAPSIEGFVPTASPPPTGDDGEPRPVAGPEPDGTGTTPSGTAAGEPTPGAANPASDEPDEPDEPDGGDGDDAGDRGNGGDGDGGSEGEGGGDGDDPRPEPIAQAVVEMEAAETEGTAAAGTGDGSCTGARLEDQEAGCTEPEGEATRVRVAPEELDSPL